MEKNLNKETSVNLNNIEIDLLINIIGEVISSLNIPEVITEDVRQELFAELNTSKILNDLKKKFEQSKEAFEHLKETSQQSKGEENKDG